MKDPVIKADTPTVKPLPNAEDDGTSNVEYDLGGKSHPGDVLANRLHSVLRIIGGPVGESAGPSWGDEQVDASMSPSNDPYTPSPAGQPTAMATGAKGQLQSYAAQQLAAHGITDPNEIGALITLWNKESGWNPNAQNPTSTAYGIAQFLNGTWAGTGYQKTSDPYKQIQAGLSYIYGRYGSPSKALKFHLAHNWY